MPSLLAKQGPCVGQRFPVERELVLGRIDADLTLDDALVSRRHARVRPAEGTIEIEDLGSLNGTWVNGERISGARRLAAGDVVAVGVSVLEVEVDQTVRRTVLTPGLPGVQRPEAPREPPVIVFREGPLAGRRFHVDPELVLGALEGDLIIDDPLVSRRHARVRRSEGALEVEDLGSLNGTWVNGERITAPRMLEPGDVVFVGDSRIDVVAEEAAGGRAGGPLSPERLARAAGARPWVAVGAWIVALAAAGLLVVALLGSALAVDAEPVAGESKRANELLAERSTSTSEADELVVVSSQALTVDEAAFGTRVREIARQIRGTGATAQVRTFFGTNDASLVSDDRRATIVEIVMGPDAEDTIERVVDVVQQANGRQNFEVVITGAYTSDRDFMTLSQDDLKKGELFFGLPAAVVVLLLVFGAAVAATVPAVLAVASIVVALGLTALVGQAYSLSLFVVNMLVGMGLALGIDYSLFIVSRFREERARGRDKLDAIAATGGTASRAVFFSGIAYVVALLGMLAIPDRVLRSLAVGAILVGLVAVAAALTLLPAVLGLLGDRVNALRVPVVGRGAELGTGREGRFWGAAAKAVMARPLVSLVLGAGLLIAAAAPAVDLETGRIGFGTMPDRFPSKQGSLALERHFTAARAEPAEVVVDGEVGTQRVRAAIDRLTARLAADEAFAEPRLTVEAQNRLARMSAPLVAPADSPAARDAVLKLRHEHIPAAFSGVPAEILVTGETAEGLDYAALTDRWRPIVFVLVLSLSFVLLLLAFRSIVVPLKAIVLNLLSVGAAYGILVLVFQKGVGNELFGFSQVETIEAWVPLFLFSVLFGLSMDYHVFLLSRIRERFDELRDNTRAVAYGVGSTARLITGAALIIIVVFAGLARGDLVMFQQVGFGVAVALLLDATIVRSVLVPASMKLLGSINWYLPWWLQRLPAIGIEGARPGAAGGAPPTAEPGAPSPALPAREQPGS